MHNANGNGNISWQRCRFRCRSDNESLKHVVENVSPMMRFSVWITLKLWRESFSFHYLMLHYKLCFQNALFASCTKDAATCLWSPLYRWSRVCNPVWFDQVKKTPNLGPKHIAYTIGIMLISPFETFPVANRINSWTSQWANSLHFKVFKLSKTISYRQCSKAFGRPVNNMLLILFLNS